MSDLVGSLKKAANSIRENRIKAVAADLPDRAADEIERLQQENRHQMREIVSYQQTILDEYAKRSALEQRIAELEKQFTDISEGWRMPTPSEDKT